MEKSSYFPPKLKSYIGGIINNTNYVSVPYYLILGFVDGAFSSSNVTHCLTHSVRFAGNISELTFHTQLGYSEHKIIKYSTQLAK